MRMRTTDVRMHMRIQLAAKVLQLYGVVHAKILGITENKSLAPLFARQAAQFRAQTTIISSRSITPGYPKGLG
jgi:hypothetical protein